MRAVLSEEASKVDELQTDQLRMMAANFPSEIGWKKLDDGTTLTFDEWDTTSNRLARGLRSDALSRGDRVAIYLPPEQGLNWLVAYAAVHKAGAVSVPTNTRLAVAELEHVFAHAEVSAVVTSADLLANVMAVSLTVPSLQLIVTTGPAQPGARSWDEALAEDSSEFREALSGDDMADIMYTSGTTGRPKGVVVRHRALAMMPNTLPTWSGLASLNCSPFSTTSGILMIYNMMKGGISGLYLPKFEAGRWLEVVETERPVAAFVVPAMAQLIVAHPKFEETDFSSLFSLTLGSAPAAPETLRRLQDAMPHAQVNFGYGMTEVGAATSIPSEGKGTHLGSVGKPIAGVELQIVDEAGEGVPAEQTGEVLIRTAGREREYYRDPEATAQSWHDGWHHSGDLGYLDDDGYLYVVGRKKDVVIRGGHNVAPGAVEAALFEHPAVQEAAVAGIPHEVLGEDVAAWVVLRPGCQADGPELRAFLLERLADYKVPRRFTFVDALPRNEAGKVIKRELVGA